MLEVFEDLQLPEGPLGIGDHIKSVRDLLNGHLLAWGAGKRQASPGTSEQLQTGEKPLSTSPFYNAVTIH